MHEEEQETYDGDDNNHDIFLCWTYTLISERFGHTQGNGVLGWARTGWRVQGGTP